MGHYSSRPAPPYTPEKSKCLRKPWSDPRRNGHPRQSPFIPGVAKPDPCTIVIFGATGDLAARKLLPALYGLWRGQYLPEQFAIVGVGRRDKTDSAFREEVQTAIEKFRQDAPAGGWLAGISFASLSTIGADFTTAARHGRALAERLKKFEAERRLPGNRLFYLATDPEYFGPAVERLAAPGWSVAIPTTRGRAW